MISPSPFFIAYRGHNTLKNVFGFFRRESPTCILTAGCEDKSKAIIIASNIFFFKTIFANKTIFTKVTLFKSNYRPRHVCYGLA